MQLSVASLLLGIALGGCQRTENVQQPVATPAKHQRAVANTLNLHGLTVSYIDGARIHVAGDDRWGTPLDTTYESVEFLRNALPVLERSITAEQLADLRALIDARR